MTGQIAFARTLRALDADNFRAPKLGLFFAIALLAAWTWWFVTPSIPQYFTLSENATLRWEPSSHEVVVTHLTSTHIIPPALRQIHLDQPARLRFDDRTIGARVVHSSSWLLHYDFALLILDVPLSISPPLPSQATIEIEAGRVSPATLLIRALYR
jgi:hypothetical protein